jgi:serine/threonine protein kinase
MAAPSSKYTFLSRGKQGCVYKGEVEDDKCVNKVSHKTTKPEGETVIKVIKNKKEYDNEMKAARVLTEKDISFTVHAYRGCSILIQSVLTEGDVNTCNSGSSATNERLPLSGAAYTIEMPYVVHTTLKKYSTKITIEKAQLWMDQLCKYMKQLHAIGVYHGDLHDGNIWVMNDDTLRIADFGSAKVTHTENDIDLLNEEEQNLIYTLIEKDKKSAIPSFIKIADLVINPRLDINRLTKEIFRTQQVHRICIGSINLKDYTSESSKRKNEDNQGDVSKTARRVLF